ncbi:MAG: hypothetical protein AABW46_02590 [Nanoarchaeota archaeon]
MAEEFPDKILNGVIEEIAGADIVPLVALIMGKSHVSEFKIAENLGITINHTRNMLYRLNEHNLVDFARKKDKKKGWYVYYWTLDMFELRDLAVRMKKDVLNKIKNRLANEKEGTYFMCPDKHIRTNLETAMEYEFRCPECDRALEKEDNVKTIENMKKMIERLEQEIATLLGLEIKPVKERKLIREPRKKKGDKKSFLGKRLRKEKKRKAIKKKPKKSVKGEKPKKLKKKSRTKKKSE